LNKRFEFKYLFGLMVNNKNKIKEMYYKTLCVPIN
jgi:hypothetical protein